MSRLLPDMRNRSSRQILWCGLTRVLVTADQLLAEHWSAGVRSRRVVTSTVLESMEPLAFKAAMASLMAQLPATPWQRIEIYLADQHVHLMRLPAVQQSAQASLSSQEKTAYARAMLLKTYGEVAMQWPFRMQDGVHGKDMLLATIPALQNIPPQTLLAPRKYLSLSIQPYVSALWAQTKLPATGTVISAEPDMVRLLQLHNGVVQHVSSLTVYPSDIQVISAWLLRERMLSGAQATPCYWLSALGCVSAHEAGRRLSKALSDQLSIQQLQSGHAITSLWPDGSKKPELAHVA